VSLSRHRQWFADKLAESASHLFVMEASGLPVGQIRFDQVAGETLVDYSVERPFRGRGWARQLVALGLHQMCQHNPAIFRADVKESNLPSRAVFHGMGFVDSASPDGSDVRVYRLDSRKSA
jgi:ribosomal protein S18 acetylase RimI-like enzyme